MSSLWEVPAYLIMAFSLALDAPVEKASRVSEQPNAQNSAIAAVDLPHGAEMPETIWLRAVKTAGPHSSVLRYYSDRVFITSSGKPYVPSDSDRAEILALQDNGEVVTRVIAAETHTNRALLIGLGNKPTPGALLIAHKYGIASAQRFCAVLERDPEAMAIEIFPEMAGELQSMPRISIAALELKLTRLVSGTPAVRTAHHGKGPHGERYVLGTASLKGTLPQSVSPSDGRVARAR